MVALQAPGLGHTAGVGDDAHPVHDAPRERRDAFGLVLGYQASLQFLVVRGAWPIFTFFTILSMIGLFFTGAYVLKGIKQVLHGPLNERWRGHLPEINAREAFVITPLMVLMLLIGVWPAWLLDVINNAVMWFYSLNS